MPELEVPAAGRRGGGGSNPSRRGGEPEQLSSASSVRGVGKRIEEPKRYNITDGMAGNLVAKIYEIWPSYRCVVVLQESADSVESRCPSAPFGCVS
jgi:hypothetical protein